MVWVRRILISISNVKKTKETTVIETTLEPHNIAVNDICEP